MVPLKTIVEKKYFTQNVNQVTGSEQEEEIASRLTPISIRIFEPSGQTELDLNLSISTI